MCLSKRRERKVIKSRDKSDEKAVEKKFDKK